MANELVTRGKRKLKPRGRPFPKGGPPGPGRKPGVPNKITQEVRELAAGMLETPAYRANLQARLEAGTAGPIEVLLWHYYKGKPKETIEHQVPMRPVVIDMLQAGDPTPDD